MQTIKLYNNIQMPCIIQATNWMGYNELKSLVREGLRIGIRAFDTARDYGNERIVGRVIHECLDEVGLKREDIFITTKIGNSQQINGDIKSEIEISLDNLQTNYVDLWLMHWPYPNYYVDTWNKMWDVYTTGKVKALGIANCEIRHLEKLSLIRTGGVPHCVQIEHHPMRTVVDTLAYLREKNIAVQSYSPLCRMINPIRTSKILQKIANDKRKSIGQVILRWHYQLNTASVFKTTNIQRLQENNNIWDFSLSLNEMNMISSLNEDYKYHLESASCPGY